MSFPDLRSFIKHLESIGELIRIQAEVDPNQELTIIQHRVLAQNGPALLFENVKGSQYRIISNMFGTKERVDLVFGGPPQKIGEKIFDLAQEIMPPTPKKLWQARKGLKEVLKARLKDVRNGPIMETLAEPADLNKLPVLTCWPEDGGPFFTLPLVHTIDPLNGRGNLGIYRLQRFDAASTGMHWQIEKGGGFHFKQAIELDQPLPVSVFLGGPPALTIAAVAPLPEGIDERMLAAFMMGSPLKVINRKQTGHRIPAAAEFVLEGTVEKGDLQWEGPFGDHFGHYSHAADFPVFRVTRVLARRDAIYPATVVGKPVQEDFHIGVALQEMAGPLLKLIRPAVVDIWAYPETGFHPLAVMSVKERYPREALKHTLGMLGEGQVSLTKIMITVGHDVDVKDFDAVSLAVWKYLKAEEGIHLLTPTAQDTLDFTGPAMNSGSRLILMATAREGQQIRKILPSPPPSPKEVHRCINGFMAWGPAFLMVQVQNDINLANLRQALESHPVTKQYLFHVLVSEDVPLGDKTMMLWGWFTRFDPLSDLYPSRLIVKGNRLIYDFPIIIDARWKPGYPKPLEFDPVIEKRVNKKWEDYNIPLN